MAESIYYLFMGCHGNVCSDEGLITVLRLRLSFPFPRILRFLYLPKPGQRNGGGAVEAVP